MSNNNITATIKAEKQKVADLINPRLSKIDSTKNKGRQTKQELIDIGKFITASKENIQILGADFEVPDFLIQWDGTLYGLEHTEVIDRKKKDTFEKTEWLIKETEKAFLNQYGNIGKQITFSLKFEVTLIDKKEKKKLLNKLLQDYKDLNFGEQKLMNLAYPGYLTREDLKLLAAELAEIAYLAHANEEDKVIHDLVNYISFYPCSKTFCNRTVSWGAGSIREPLLTAIEEKESKIDTYIKNTKGLKQCLFLLIQGSNGYSDYSFFDDTVLSNRATPFDKVIAFNFFTNDFFILK
jgi:hypothetical protein